MTIEWNPSGDRSLNKEWAIQTFTSAHDPMWRMFSVMPEVVVAYKADHPGDTDSWSGRYSASFTEMHDQAERLLKTATKWAKSTKRTKEK